MSSADLRNLGDAELEERIDEIRRDQFTLRFQKSMGRLENTSRIMKNRRELARLLTVRRERELWRLYESGQAADQR